MTLTQAIELLSLYEHAASSIPRDDFLEAQNLLIEAGKNLIHQRADWLVRVYKPLPGETKE